MQLVQKLYAVINGTKSTTDTSSFINSAEEGISGQSGTQSEKLSYCDLFESCIPGGAFSLVRDAKIRQDIEESLRKRVLAVRDPYKPTKGRKRLQLDDQNKRFHVFEEYITSVRDIKEENKVLQDELLEWRKKYSTLEDELEKLYNEMNVELGKRDVKIRQQKECNEQLLIYAKQLEKEVPDVQRQECF
jgi:hypothetical protein